MRIFNLENVRPIRDLDPIDIDSLVAIKGMITRTGNIIPDLRCGEVLQGTCMLLYVLLQRPWACRMLLNMSAAGRGGRLRQTGIQQPTTPACQERVCVCRTLLALRAH